MTIEVSITTTTTTIQIIIIKNFFWLKEFSDLLSKYKFGKIVIFVDRATPNCSKITKQYLAQNKEIIRFEYFHVGCPEFNTVEVCWRQGKYHILSTYPTTFDSLKYDIYCYYRNTRFNPNIVKYMMRTFD
ncbi:MAG: hypothetical protein ACE5SW_11035 [Nitrososphaeraceae archaeon]